MTHCTVVLPAFWSLWNTDHCKGSRRAWTDDVCRAKCHAAASLKASAQADGNSTGAGNPKGYCYAEQPAWSVYRESSFGHGTLDLLNSTTALWSCEHPFRPSHACLRKHLLLRQACCGCCTFIAACHLKLQLASMIQSII